VANWPPALIVPASLASAAVVETKSRALDAYSLVCSSVKATANAAQTTVTTAIEIQRRRTTLR
jgi:hypothetical protein